MATSKKDTAANGEITPEVVLAKSVAIQPVRFERASFNMIGLPDVPLVIHRFSAKTKKDRKSTRLNSSHRP